MLVFFFSLKKSGGWRGDGKQRKSSSSPLLRHFSLPEGGAIVIVAMSQRAVVALWLVISPEARHPFFFFFLHPPNMLGSRLSWRQKQVTFRNTSLCSSSSLSWGLLLGLQALKKHVTMSTWLNHKKKGCDVGGEEKKSWSFNLQPFLNQYFSHMSRLKRYILYLRCHV